MKFLIDKNLSRRLSDHLTRAGRPAVHVDDVDLGSADDATILAFAARGGFTIVSSDTDFGTLLAAGRLPAPSVILTREVSTMPPTDLGDLLLANLDDIAEALEQGAVVAIGPEVLRLRRLPLR